MSAPGGGARTSVLVAAAGAPWEAPALDRLGRAARDIVLTKRCVDLTDLLATASAGLASVALVSPTLPGLDADSVAQLARSGVAVVVVAAPEELQDGDTERLRRLGVLHLLASTELDSLVATVGSAGTDAAPSPPVAAGPAPGGTTEAEPGEGRLVAVWGPTGAPGRTTVAVGLATELAAAGHEVLLVDVDGYGGAVAQHLGVLDEVSGVLAAARAANTGRLDRQRLAACARQVDDRLRVLTGLPRPDRWREVRPAAFEDLLDETVRLAPYAVLDVGFCLEGDPADPFGSSAPQRNEMTLASLRRADEIVVVGAADPVGLARLARGLVELLDVVPGVRPRVVVNRTRPSLGWTDREIRGMVEGFVTPLDVHFLPDDRAAADRALMAGRSLAESGESTLRTAMTALARGVLGEPAVPVARRRPLRRRRAGRDR
jgi:Flp pilus assembly CpaE family ATPase